MLVVIFIVMGKTYGRYYTFLSKLNTVVNSHNWMEDIVFEVNQLKPVRWKVIIFRMRI